MEIETGSINMYQEYLTFLPNVDQGIVRIKKFLCWPDENENSGLGSYLPCFYEYITFHEGVVIPFFQILHAILSSHISSLYTFLRDNGKEPTSFLTHDEAFDFLCSLGLTDSRNIIDHYNSLPSNVYTGVINSIRTQDKIAFSAALKETDCQDLMKVLWTMRFILYGIQSEKDVRVIKRGKGIQMENLWLADTGLAAFFRNIPQEQEGQFIKERIKLLSGYDTKSIARRQRIGRQRYDGRDVAQTKPYLHYIDYERKSWKQYLTEPEKDDTTLIAFPSVAYNCKVQTYKILFSALKKHEDAISQRFGNVGGKSFSVAIEQKWKDEDWDYVELEFLNFLDFITLSLHQIKSVYLIVEGFLHEEDKVLLNWIVSLYTNDGQQDVLVDKYQKASYEGQSIDNGDNTIPKGKWYVKVLDSKLRGNNSEEKNAKLLKCLSLLYEELTKDGSNLIDTATPKDLLA